MAGELGALGSFGLNRFGSKVTKKLPSPIRNAVGFALNFRRFKEPHMSYKWEFSLPKLNFRDVKGSSKLGSYTPTVVGCSVPFSGYDTEDVYINTTKYSLPISSNTGDLTLRVLHENDGKALYYFECWKQAVKDKEGRYQYSDVYKKNLYCKLLNLAGGELNIIKLSGCFPKNINVLNLSYDSSEATYFDVEMSVDIVPLMELKTNLLSLSGLTDAGKDLLGKAGNFFKG